MSIIGIDFGSSITKVIEYDNEEIKNKLITKEKIPKKVLDEFIKINNINLKHIKQIVLTGVGIKKANEDIYDIPTIKVDEFISIGLGGSKLAKKEKAIIISIRNWNCFCACR